MTIDTRFMEIGHWSALTAASLASVGFAATQADEDHWREWASTVCAIPKVAATGVPRPEGFDRWQDWAHRLNEGLRLIGL